MSDTTFRSRLAHLVHKCRKAVRLYTSMGRQQLGEANDHAERQIHIWRDTNADLLRELGVVVEIGNGRELVQRLYSIRDKFYDRWREAETDMHLRHREIVLAAESEEYIKVALLAEELINLKAKTQASKAAHHELQGLVGKSKITQLEEASAAPNSEMDLESPLLQQAKVIPIRRVR